MGWNRARDVGLTPFFFSVSRDGCDLFFLSRTWEKADSCSGHVCMLVALAPDPGQAWSGVPDPVRFPFGPRASLTAPCPAWRRPAFPTPSLQGPVIWCWCYELNDE